MRQFTTRAGLFSAVSGITAAAFHFRGEHGARELVPLLAPGTFSRASLLPNFPTPLFLARTNRRYDDWKYCAWFPAVSVVHSLLIKPPNDRFGRRHHDAPRRHFMSWCLDQTVPCPKSSSASNHQKCSLLGNFQFELGVHVLCR